MSLATNIKKLRMEKGLTQIELAEFVKVTPAYIALLESGKKENPTMKILKKIASNLDTSIGELLK